MKISKIRQDNAIGSEKSYIPDIRLVNFLQDWLHLHKKRDELTKNGKELSDDEKKKIRELDRMKVYYLDSIIFPSMVNLIYFFEALSASRRLFDAFEDEVEELLDPRNSKEAAQFSSGGWRLASLQFRGNNLARLIDAMLSVPRSKSEVKDTTTNFRISLLYQLQTIIGDAMDNLISMEFSFGNQIWKSAMEDYGRMMGWLALLTKSVKDHPQEYDRKIGFLPTKYSNKATIQEIEF